MSNFPLGTIYTLRPKKIRSRISLLKSYARINMPWPVRTKLRDPIFIIGSSSSGTSMLTGVLASLPKICDFSEKPIVRHQMWRMVENPSEITHGLPELEKMLVRLSGIKSGQRLIEKTPGHSLIADALVKYFSGASFIHIVRNGQDVASSMLRHKWISRELREEVPVFWFHRLPEFYQEEWRHLDPWERGVLRWAVYVTSARKAKLQAERYLEVNYEDICRSPQELMYHIISFLHVEPSQEFDRQVLKIRPLNPQKPNHRAIMSSQNEFYRGVLTRFSLNQV